MDWLDKRVLTNTFRMALLLVLVVVTYLLYSWYKAENLAEYERQNLYLHPRVIDSLTPLQIRASVEQQIDSIKKASGGDSLSSFAIHVNPTQQQTDSLAPAPVVLHQSNSEKSSAVKSVNNTPALQGPSAFFSHTYTIAVGQTMPVNIVWAKAGARASNFALVTVKAEDIADKKARFTIEDPFNVLVFSQTGYAAGDKIVIEDERHHLNISILKVTAKAAVIKIDTHLDENLVSKLKRSD